MIGWLAFAAFILLFIIIIQIARTSELSSLLKGDPDDTEYSSKVNGTLLMLFLILGFIGMVYSGMKFIPLMLPTAASVHGLETDKLFNTTLLYTGIVFVLTQIALFWFAFRYREKKGQKAFFYSHNNKLEVVWTIIPAIVMTVLVVSGLKAWFNIFPGKENFAEDRMMIEVTAKQFNWTVRYSGLDDKFGERIIDKEHISPTNELGINWEDVNSHDDILPKEIHLIKDKPVEVVLGALDVLHSFYLPHFRVKMDCVPGIPTGFYFIPNKTTKEMQEELSNEPAWQEINPETGEPKWKNFKYELACAELCGKSHYAMQMNVIVETEEEFNKWLSEQKSYYDLVVKPTLKDDTQLGIIEREESVENSAAM